MGQKWIQPSERLPEPDQTVFYCLKGAEPDVFTRCRRVYYGYFSKDEDDDSGEFVYGYGGNFSNLPETVLAWMPMDVPEYPDWMECDRGY